MIALPCLFEQTGLSTPAIVKEDQTMRVFALLALAIALLLANAGERGGRL